MCTAVATQQNCRRGIWPAAAVATLLPRPRNSRSDGRRGFACFLSLQFAPAHFDVTARYYYYYYYHTSRASVWQT